MPRRPGPSRPRPPQACWAWSLDDPEHIADVDLGVSIRQVIDPCRVVRVIAVLRRDTADRVRCFDDPAERAWRLDLVAGVDDTIHGNAVMGGELAQVVRISIAVIEAADLGQSISTLHRPVWLIQGVRLTCGHWGRGLSRGRLRRAGLRRRLPRRDLVIDRSTQPRHTTRQTSRVDLAGVGVLIVVMCPVQTSTKIDTC